MRKLTSWALRCALVGGATGAIVAACYNDVPGPSAPLPPTREVAPLGGKPQPITPTPVPPIAIDAGVPITSRVIELNTRIAPEPPTAMPDAGPADVIDLPPLADADIVIDAPGIEH